MELPASEVLCRGHRPRWPILWRRFNRARCRAARTEPKRALRSFLSQSNTAKATRATCSRAFRSDLSLAMARIP